MKRKKWETPRLIRLLRKTDTEYGLSCCKMHGEEASYLPAGPSALARYCTSMRPDCRPLNCYQIDCS